jgi:hypothetical protein
MTKTKLTIAAGALALGLATLHPPTQAQGPLYDKVNVSLPYAVTIGDRTLQPGDYEIRQLPSASNPRVLLISSDKGMKFETSAMTIPALDNRTPEDTKVVLHHFGPDYYFDKIWIQGKNYGYEFPLPDSVRSRERERTEPVSVGARYETTPAETTTTTAESQAPARTEEPAPAPAPAEPAPAQEPVTTAQAQPPAPAPEPALAPEPAPAPEPQVTQPAPATTPTAGEADRAMPDTAAHWLTLLLGGGLLSGAGLALRRKR